MKLSGYLTFGEKDYLKMLKGILIRMQTDISLNQLKQQRAVIYLEETEVGPVFVFSFFFVSDYFSFSLGQRSVCSPVVHQLNDRE